MNAKNLLLAFSAVAFVSCSTVYKSGQTPDDVYYSPVRPVFEKNNDDSNNDQPNSQYNSVEEQRMRMTIRDRRWRDFDDDYYYSYNYSPYNYCTSNYNNYGYYYNPYYYSKPLYYPTVNFVTKVNNTPRMVNLNAYKNYTEAVTNTNAKTGKVNTTYQSSRQYNNSNNSGSKFGNVLREVFVPNQSANSNSNHNESSNNNRTYTPSTNTPSSSSGGSSSGSSSGSSVARPSRGGN